MDFLRLTRIVPGALAAAIFMAAPAMLAQAARTAGESELKAAFVYNFARFVTWPESTAEPFSIGVLGDPGLAAALRQILEGKTLHDRPLIVVSMESVNELRATDVLYIGDGTRRNLEDVMKVIAGLPVLTVGDSDNFTQAGGIVGLFEENRKMRFDVNVAAAEGSGLKIRAQLLQLARTVRN